MLWLPWSQTGDKLLKGDMRWRRRIWDADIHLGGALGLARLIGQSAYVVAVK